MKIDFKEKIFKILTPIFLHVLKFYWFIFRPRTFGVKVVIRDNNRILLIKNSYGTKNWTFPGGTIKKYETPEQASEREAVEELNIEVTKLSFIDSFISTKEYKEDKIYVFSAISKNSKVSPNSSEIKEARWFETEEIPALNTIAQTIWDLYENKQ